MVIKKRRALHRNWKYYKRDAESCHSFGSCRNFIVFEKSKKEDPATGITQIVTEKN
jgi:hypothetical protein